MIIAPGVRRALSAALLPVAATSAAAALGILFAMSLGTGRSSIGGEINTGEAGVGSGLVGEAQAVLSSDPGDARINFPEGLKNFPDSPFDIAVDPKTGDVWFAIFPNATQKYVLYRNDPVDGSAQMFDLPFSPASGLFSAIAIAPNGHVILGYGHLVLDFDPATAAYKSYELPPDSANSAALDDLEGTWVTDLAVSASGRIFVTRMNVAAVTVVDPVSGALVEIPFPKSFGPAYHIALGSDGVYMTSWGDRPNRPAQTVVLDTDTGVLRELGGKSSNLASTAGGVVYGAEMPTPGLVKVADPGFARIAFADASLALSGNWDFLAVDPNSGAIWTAGEGAGYVARVDPASGRSEVFKLPNLTVSGRLSGCPYSPAGGCPDSTEVLTRIRGMAVAPNGDLYFTDAQNNRIGIVDYSP